MYAFALAWTKAAVLGPEDRLKVHGWLLHHGQLNVPVGNETIFEHYIEPVSGQWRHWKDKVRRIITHLHMS